MGRQVREPRGGFQKGWVIRITQRACQNMIAGPTPRVSHLVGLGESLRICIYNKCPGDEPVRVTVSRAALPRELGVEQGR